MELQVSASPGPKTGVDAAGIEYLMRPRSVAIIGMSSKPGTPSHTVLRNLLSSDFTGEVYLVGRSGGTIEGRSTLR